MTVMRMKRHLAVLALVSAVWALAGCGGGKSGEQGKTDSATDSTKVDSTAAAKKKEKKTPEGVPVKVHRVQQGSISSYLLYNAKVEAEETVDVYAHGSGLVKRVLAVSYTHLTLPTIYSV